MKRYCVNCESETEMRERLEDLDADTGVFVRASVCTRCGGSYTDAHEFERAEKEFKAKNVLVFEKKIVKLGNSLGLWLPKEISKAARVGENKAVRVYVDNQRRIIVEAAR
ncbi:MAG TPA: hypothetical protein HA252_06175 [Candidatus Diapherotrites archaeon]|uniref:AbrB/MazE/SpoVT family DNA-binding domain-containing protein n=1 Tax=Candidatus Iainarchaeum sp. TaxID=3101447 RepID=A0A7J4JI19_9ARCH|nr:hypothetical protein [Candidatus Diapherotrites archaeon]